MTPARNHQKIDFRGFVAASLARHLVFPLRFSIRRNFSAPILSLSALLCALCVSALAFVFPSAAAEEHASTSTVVELKLDGEVEPILATYIDEGLADAVKAQTDHEFKEQSLGVKGIIRTAEFTPYANVRILCGSAF